jgi:hypothetical protein
MMSRTSTAPGCLPSVASIERKRTPSPPPNRCHSVSVLRPGANGEPVVATPRAAAVPAATVPAATVSSTALPYHL